MIRRLLLWAALGGSLLAGVHLYRWAALAGQGYFRPIDFYSFYVGAAIVRDGLGSRLYDFGLQAQYQIGLFGEPLSGGFLLPYVSPPQFALLLMPLAWFKCSVALFIWLGMQIALAGALVQCCLRGSAQLPLHERILLLAALVSFPMLVVTVFKGQLSLVLLLCVIGWIEALRRGSDLGVAGWLLLGSVKPQLILVPVLLTIMARRWRALFILAASAGSILLLCGLILGPACLTGFVAATRWVDSNYDHRLVYPAYMYNFKGFLTLLLGLNHLPLIKILSSAGLVAAAVLIACLWRARVETRDRKFDLKVALSLLLGLFFTLHLYYYDVLLLVAVAYLFHKYFVQTGRILQRGLFLGAALLFPPLFLESALISLGGHWVRWPIVLMVAWAAWMYLLILTEQEPKRLPNRSPNGAAEPVQAGRGAS